MGRGEGILVIQLSREMVPILEAYLEYLLLVNFRDEYQIVECLEAGDRSGLESVSKQG